MHPVVVLPTYNEVATLEEVLRRTRAALPDATVLVVDDSSPDGTAELAEKAGDELGGIHVLRRPGRLGLGTAYRDGFRWALDHGADALVEMDSDLSHDPAALPDLIGPLATNDLVIGSRYVPGGRVDNWGLHRRLLSKGGNRYASFMLGVSVRDMTSGFRAYRASLVRDLDLDSVRADGYGFQVEMAYRAVSQGARVVEVPIRFVDREVGQSKMSGRIVVEALVLITRWGGARAWRSVARRLPARSDAGLRSR